MLTERPDVTIDPAPKAKIPTGETDLRALLSELEAASVKMPAGLVSRAVDTILALAGERDQADRRAGASEREKAAMEERERRANAWLLGAKEAAGYDSNVSFDRVWEETLVKARLMDSSPRMRSS